MRMLLDGCDWQADYFIAHENYKKWVSNARLQHNQLMDSVFTSDFIKPDYDGAGCLTGTIPGCDRTFLEENGLSEDTYFARNLEKTRWVENHAWAFRKKFFLPESWKECRRIILKCRGLDYEANILVNGFGAGYHKGMFIPAELDITELVKSGESNLLVIGFEPMPQASPNHFDHECAEFTKYHRWQMSYGWDWSRHMSSASIWDSVELIGYKTARVKDFYVRYDDRQVFLDVEIESQEACDLPLDVEITPDNFNGQSGSVHTVVSLKRGSNSCTVAVELPDMHSWNPIHYGNPDCYQIAVTLDGNTETKITGFKTLEMRYNPNSPEGAYPLTFTVNGREIFVRGLNYVPIDMMFARNTPADYDRVVKLAAEAGFNLFRIWGGGMVEKEAFYAACDRHGVMVWQEFMHACSNYPKDAEFLAFKKREGEAILRKIRNHVSIVMLCGGNEMQYYGEIPDSPLLIQYRELGEKFAPHLPYHISCPDLSRPGERNHGPWHFQEHSVYNKHHRLLASEIGCNGMPEFASLKKFIPENEIKAMHGQSLHYHFFNDDNRKNLWIPAAEFSCQDMEQFCQASMASQADALQYIMAHYRRLAPEASGCYIWQYNEPWPTCAYSIIDYYTVPKMAYYTLAKANAPYLVSVSDESWCIRESGVNGRCFVTVPQEFAGTVTAEAFEVSGRSLWKKELAGVWQNGSTEVFTFAGEVLPQADSLLLLRLTLTGTDGKVYFSDTRLYGVPDFKSAFALPQTSVACTAVKRDGEAVRFTIANTGSAAALKVRLSIPGVPEKSVYWRDNYVTLLPGENMDVEAVVASDIIVDNPEFSGWNI